MKSVPDKKIFISYRVQDTAGETGRLVDALKHHFSDDQLFMDIENLEPGADFTEAIGRSLGACDVFLAVIGPRWTGAREGQPSRINDPNDWVRVEVSTALQRNVRVVPVLVDGASLPKPEELPPELQPLLRRQTLEISNKRWRYDTDQLILFLVNTVGIPRRRAQVAQRMTAVSAKKPGTWLYVAVGFALAFVLFLVFAVLAPQEAKNSVAERSSEMTASPQTGAADEEPAPQNTITNNAETVSGTENISGTWQEVDEGLTATFVITQTGQQVVVQASTAGEPIGNGNGVITGRNVELNVPMFGIATNLRGTLSADGNVISGTYTVPATGAVQAFRLVRK